MTAPLKNRRAAGRQLAERLQPYAEQQPIVLGLPRGGITVAYEIAIALQAPLDVCLVRKLGMPSQPELAMGAISVQGFQWLEPRLTEQISAEQFEQVSAREQACLAYRAERYAPYRPALPLRNRTVLVVDDGVATGATLLAALKEVRSREPSQVVIAVPVMAAAMHLPPPFDRYPQVVLYRPTRLAAIGCAYQDFTQVSDAVVCEALQRVNARTLSSHTMPDRAEPNRAMPSGAAPAEARAYD